MKYTLIQELHEGKRCGLCQTETLAPTSLRCSLCRSRSTLSRGSLSRALHFAGRTCSPVQCPLLPRSPTASVTFSMSTISAEQRSPRGLPPCLLPSHPRRASYSRASALHVGLAPCQVREVLELAKAIKPILGTPAYQPFSLKTLSMIFTKPSTRTRVSFESGCRRCGSVVGWWRLTGGMASHWPRGWRVVVGGWVGTMSWVGR